MKYYNGGAKVPKGVYLNLLHGEFVNLYGQVRVLPGDEKVRYIKVPGIFAMVAGPSAGLAFVIFLPLAGIIGILAFLGYKVWRGTAALGRKVFQPVAVREEPGMAYLTQQRGGQKGKEAEKEQTDTGIKQITDEVALRRQKGEK